MDGDDRYVKTGIFLAPFHPLNESPLLALERDMDLLIQLDKLNYHEAWIGEHHSGGFEIINCPEMFIAAALLHLSVGHVLLLPLVGENGHGTKKFHPHPAAFPA